MTRSLDILRGDVGDVHIHAHGLIQEIQQKRAAQPLPQGRQPRLAEDRVPHVALAGEIHQGFGDIHAFKLHHFRAEPRRQLQVVLKLALDKDNQVCGYQFLSLGKMMDAIKKGMNPNEAYEKNVGTYGRFKAEDGAVAWIDPRKQ